MRWRHWPPAGTTSQVDSLMARVCARSPVALGTASGMPPAVRHNMVVFSSSAVATCARMPCRPRLIFVRRQPTTARALAFRTPIVPPSRHRLRARTARSNPRRTPLQPLQGCASGRGAACSSCRRVGSAAGVQCAVPRGASVCPCHARGAHVCHHRIYSMPHPDCAWSCHTGYCSSLHHTTVL